MVTQLLRSWKEAYEQWLILHDPSFIVYRYNIFQLIFIHFEHWWNMWINYHLLEFIRPDYSFNLLILKQEIIFLQLDWEFQSECVCWSWILHLRRCNLWWIWYSLCIKDWRLKIHHWCFFETDCKRHSKTILTTNIEASIFTYDEVNEHKDVDDDDNTWSEK